MATCRHVMEIAAVQPGSHECLACKQLGDSWVHLRACLTCGTVGCCDSSKNAHATKHFETSQHPVMRSIEPGEGWMWCYVDELMLP